MVLMYLMVFLFILVLCNINYDILICIYVFKLYKLGHLMLETDNILKIHYKADV